MALATMRKEDGTIVFRDAAWSPTPPGSGRRACSGARRSTRRRAPGCGPAVDPHVLHALRDRRSVPRQGSYAYVRVAADLKPWRMASKLRRESRARAARGTMRNGQASPRATCSCSRAQPPPRRLRSPQRLRQRRLRAALALQANDEAERSALLHRSRGKTHVGDARSF